MSSNILGRSGLLAAAAALLTACSPDGAGSPVAPAAEVYRPSLEVVRPPVLASTLDRATRLRENVTVFAVIGPEGGEFKIKSAGLKVDVPAGAVATRTIFRATAIAGDAFAYDFGPHGIQFAKPLKMEQEFPRRVLDRMPHDARLEVAYFASTRQLNVLGSEVVVNEFLPLEVDVKRNKIKWEVHHFSGYVVSSGRKGTVTSSSGY